MFFYLAKIFTFLLMPYTQMCIWFILSISLKNRRWKKRFLYLGIFYLFFFSNRFIINEVLLKWEIPPTPLAELHGDYGAAIVLGGVTNSERTPRDRVYFFRGADRVVMAAWLYKAGIVDKILVSGGSSNLINTTYKEADNLSRFLINYGVKKTDILVEDKARNTYENAIFSEEILKKNNMTGRRHLVLTSAYHLRRSLLCFKTTDLDVEGFSVDFYGNIRKFTPDKLLLPDPTAFSDWQKVIREIEGIVFYWIAGYI
jgi:uncharacterized SAM-binding protein YcdF (DUF218 family)